MMYRRFIAIVLGVAVAVTGLSTTPARADNDDLLKILGGVAAVAIIGAAISEARKDDRVSRQLQYNHAQRIARQQQRQRQAQRHHRHYRDDYRAQPLPARVQRKLLPASCRLRARNRNGTFPAFGNWCLERKFRYTHSLPQQCASRATVVRNGNIGKVYRSHCLRRHGYTTAQY